MPRGVAATRGSQRQRLPQQPRLLPLSRPRHRLPEHKRGRGPVSVPTTGAAAGPVSWGGRGDDGEVTEPDPATGQPWTRDNA
jgi:hypothetical protein